MCKCDPLQDYHEGDDNHTKVDASTGTCVCVSVSGRVSVANQHNGSV